MNDLANRLRACRQTGQLPTFALADEAAKEIDELTFLLSKREFGGQSGNECEECGAQKPGPHIAGCRVARALGKDT